MWRDTEGGTCWLQKTPCNMFKKKTKTLKTNQKMEFQVPEPTVRSSGVNGSRDEEKKEAKSPGAQLRCVEN